MHSQLALTEHASQNLAPLILLDPVHYDIGVLPFNMRVWIPNEISVVWSSRRSHNVLVVMG